MRPGLDYNVNTKIVITVFQLKQRNHGETTFLP